MIYNFLNQRADPGELKFNAFLFRNPFDVIGEERILFGFLDDLQGGLRNGQLQYRMTSLAESIRDYEKEYGRILRVQLGDDYERVEIDNLKNILRDRGTFEEAKRSKLIDIRAKFEEALYEYFEIRFSYLYCFLEHYSLEVKFFGNFTEREIEKTEPFIRCENAAVLTDRIRAAVEARGDPPTFEQIQKRMELP
jgi:hypothetical protein